MVLGLILKFLNILLMNRTTFNVFHYYHSFIVNRKVVLLQTDKQNKKMKLIMKFDLESFTKKSPVY